MLNRLPPALPAGAYKTYQLLAPVSTHYRLATCAEVNCEAYRYGWAITVFAGSDDEQVLRRAGRQFLAEDAGDGFIRFVFPQGQPCFRVSTHRIALEREPLYFVRRGTWVRDPNERLPVLRRHVNGDDWAEDFGEHQQCITDRVKRG